MTKFTFGFASSADCSEGWILVAHSVTPTLISLTILHFGQWAASCSRRPFISGSVGGTSELLMTTICALPLLRIVAQSASSLPIWLNPTGSDAAVSGLTGCEGS